MPQPRPRAKSEASDRTLAIAATVVGVTLLFIPFIVRRTSSAIDASANRLVQTVSPSIDRLAMLRAATAEIELALLRYLDAGPANRAAAGRALEASQRVAKQQFEQYRRIPPIPEGHAQGAAVTEAWARFDEAVRGSRDLAGQGRTAEARELFVRHVEPAASGVVDAAVVAIDFHAHHGSELAERIRDTRERTLWMLVGLTILSVLLAATGALLVHRQARARRALARAHAEQLEARAAELEQFAGRVAHDIRNPLSSAHMAAQLCLRRECDVGTRELAGRIVRSLDRAEAITSALLEFARAGAKPDPGARAAPREILADVEPTLEEEAQRARIELRIEPAPPVLVACSTGVYLSLLGNLVRNAIKYMGEASTRRITVRVEQSGAVVRTLVADTGPGIPAAMLGSIFEPYFRAHGGAQEGLGLGLATVKKLVDGHGGRAGVESTPGRGSTFWFELPLAGSAAGTTMAADGATVTRD